jgi:hypothetical protein
MTISKTTKWIIGLSVLLLACIVVIALLYTRQRELKLQVKAKDDVTVHSTNKHGEAVSENTAFVGTIRDLKDQVKNWERKGDSLRSKINSKTRQVTLLQQKLSITGTGKPDTVFRDSIVYIGKEQVENSDFNIHEKDSLHEFTLSANKKKYAYDFKAILKTELLTEDLGGAGTKVTAINRSKYIIESETKSLIVPMKKPSFLAKFKWIGVGVGIGGVGAAVFLK